MIGEHFRYDFVFVSLLKSKSHLNLDCKLTCSRRKEEGGGK